MTWLKLSKMLLCYHIFSFSKNLLANAMSLHDIVHLANSYGRSIDNIKEPNGNFSLCIAGKPYNGVMKVLY